MGETLTFGFTYVPFGRRRRRQCLLADTLWGREVVVYVGFFFSFRADISNRRRECTYSRYMYSTCRQCAVRVPV